jgi:hypothetical protein
MHGKRTRRMDRLSAGRYALGIVGLLILTASLALTATALRRRLVPELSGASARLAEFVIALAWLVAVMELLGTVGLFSFAPLVVGTALSGGFAAWKCSPATRRGHGSEAPSAVALLLCALAVGTVGAEWAAPTLKAYDVGVRTFDSLWYHLPWAAWFAHTGQVTPLHYTDVEYLTPFYPATAELFHGLGIVLFGHDTLSPMLNLGWLGLTLLAAYCLGREYGVGALTTVGGALALATPMIVNSQAGSAANDIPGVFFLLAAAALIPTQPVTGGRLAVAAVAAGLAVGTKLTLLAPVTALTLAVLWLAPRRQRLSVARTWVGLGFLAGGFWYVRNLIAIGNPLPWVSLPGLAKPTPALQQHTGYSVAHYLGHSRFWNDFFGDAMRSGLGMWWPAVVGAMLLGPLLCLAAPDRRRRALGAVALACTAAYVITPETAAGPSGNPLGFAFNLRYAAPALTLSLTVLPLAPWFAGSCVRRLSCAVALVAIAVATVDRSGLWPSQYLGGAVGVGAGMGLALLAGAAGVRVLRRGVGVRVGLAATLLALVGAGAAAGYSGERHYIRSRYHLTPGFNFLGHTWVRFRNTKHLRIGIVGTFGGFFTYPLFGVDASNQVFYVGRLGPHGSFTPITGCRGWRAAVNAGHFDYVITTPGRDPWDPKHLHTSPEMGWTITSPGATAVLEQRAQRAWIAVFRITGRLDPVQCG